LNLVAPKLTTTELLIIFFI